MTKEVDHEIRNSRESFTVTISRILLLTITAV